MSKTRFEEETEMGITKIDEIHTVEKLISILRKYDGSVPVFAASYDGWVHPVKIFSYGNSLILSAREDDNA